MPFQVDQASNLIRCGKTHEMFLTDWKTLAALKKYKEFVKRENWKPTLLNYIRSIPEETACH
jgi:hypothetical protein